jgi:drug/metabolite transporter (DMT)-like permease
MVAVSGGLWLGFALALGAALCYQGGYAIQALEARRTATRHSLRPSMLGHLLRRPVWLAATGLSLVGWPLQILALTQAPLALVQPTIALGLLLLLALGVKVLGEPVGRREVMAVVILVSAVALFAWAAPPEVTRIPRDAALVAALAGLGALAAAPFAIASLPGGRRPIALLIVGAGAADALAALVARLIADDVSAGAWGSSAAWAACAGGAILLGVIAESTALQRSAATRVAPAILIIQVCVPVILARFLGGESWSGTPLDGGVLWLAIAALVGGVALLGSSPAVGGALAEAAGEDGVGQGSLDRR